MLTRTTPSSPRVSEVVRRVEAVSDELEACAAETEKLGMLSAGSVHALRLAGVVRMLQPPEHGGEAAHPRDFAEAVMAVARHCGSSGWVAGVLGVHPWEVALLDPLAGEEVWGQDPEAWVASPYSPSGVADPVEGGFVLNGRWQFATGTDHASWAFLGATMGNGGGNGNSRPANAGAHLHLLVSRSDYEIVPDTWDVIGLMGTGSKDVMVRDAFVPSHRVVMHKEVANGVQAERAGRPETLYHMPFAAVFSLGLTAAVVGMAEGALAAHLSNRDVRVATRTLRVSDDPYSMYAVGEAAAEISASRTQLLDGVTSMYAEIEHGRLPGLAQVADLRRNQIRAAWRAVRAVDEIFGRSGGNAGRRDHPLQRFWRDAHMGLQHFIHMPGLVYHASALYAAGADVPDELRRGI